MLQVTYLNSWNELLVIGCRNDYEQFALLIQQLFALTEQQEAILYVDSQGDISIQNFMIRKGSSPNKVAYSASQIIFSISPVLIEQFLSFIRFPSDENLPDSPIEYHHHYDGASSNGTYVSLDSLPVVFALKSHDKLSECNLLKK